MFNTVSFCLHGIHLNVEITVNGEIIVFLFLLRKLKLAVFLPIFILLKQNVNIPSNVVHSIPIGSKLEIHQLNMNNDHKDIIPLI